MSQTSTPTGTVGIIENTKNKSLIIHNETHIESIKPKQIILDEDTYTDALSEIIKRDFFPSLLTLEAQHDYVDAWREWDTPVSTSDSNIFKIPAPKKYNTNLPLDAFQAKYTRSSDNKTGEISSWKYKVKNTLMFYPEGENQIPEDNPRRAPKQIVHSATRFESQDENTIYNHAAATAAAATVSGTNMDSTSESDTPRVGGYGFVSATPSPSPSQFDSSELMTWGVIEGSPQLIGGDQTPEIIGMNLSSNASRNIRKRNLSLKSPGLSSPSPLSRMASPRVRAALLSPAARKLLRKSNLTPRGSRASGNHLPHLHQNMLQRKWNH
ncbi:3924_t:CDS:2 [Diversispora eburnea]|uniref:3924_t:CDS:1 n=1 Tax=Diversispora eburnea TaxID=1213867 RepID=A0A9N9CN99_9GLOM|nr:3924_t:CDS:2 [Diversispora eburnea]